jgi:hypothetical protein
MRWSAAWTWILAASATFARAQTAPQDQISHKSDPDAEEKKTLLLEDFKPVSMLHAGHHDIQEARFYVIDVHLIIGERPAKVGLKSADLPCPTRYSRRSIIRTPKNFSANFTRIGV